MRVALPWSRTIVNRRGFKQARYEGQVPYSRYKNISPLIYMIRISTARFSTRLATLPVVSRTCLSPLIQYGRGKRSWVSAVLAISRIICSNRTTFSCLSLLRGQSIDSISIATLID